MKDAKPPYEDQRSNDAVSLLREMGVPDGRIPELLRDAEVIKTYLHENPQVDMSEVLYLRLPPKQETSGDSHKATPYPMNYISELQKTIRTLHGVEARRVDTVHVVEEFNGKVIWDGKVDVFELLNHPKTKIAYAWSYLDSENRQQTVTVLHIAPIDTPQRAVRASIVARLRAASSATAQQS